MNLLDRLLGHDAWTTNQLLTVCEGLSDEQLDREFDIGHRTIRRTLDHIIHNMEVWSAMMANESIERAVDMSVSGLINRLGVAALRLSDVAQRVSKNDAWEELWYDHLENPPAHKRFGTAIAHVLTHSMHHRAQVLYMLRLCGVTDPPEGDVFSWESAAFGS